MIPAVFGRTTEYSDTDLTFVCQTRHDTERLTWMLGHLRRHYPDARVVICSDGDDDPRLPGIASTFAAEFHLGEHLFPLQYGGRVCHRLLELFFRQPTRYLFKIDPDTGFHRRFHYLPTHAGMFGTLQGNSSLISIQGGCAGFARQAAERIFQSAALLDPSLLDPAATWAYDPQLLQHVRARNLVCEDWMFGYVMMALGIPHFGFREVASSWQHYIPNPNLRFAVTHPCKSMVL